MDTTEFKLPEGDWADLAKHYMKESIPEMPKITVVIPTYNQAHVLMQTLQSFFEQRNVEKELIIVDAGSTDPTYSYLQQHRDKIKRIYYVTKYNLALMINKGVSLASGQYVCFIFPGYRYLNPYSLCQISRVAYENYSPDIVFSANNHVKEAVYTSKMTEKENIYKLEPSFTLSPFTRTFLKRGFIPTLPFCMWFRVDSFREIGQLNYNYGISKSIFDYLCRLEKKKDLRVATTYWAICSSESSDKHFVNMSALFGRLVLIFKYYGPLEGLFWFLRDKPLHIIAWLFKMTRMVFLRR